MSAVETGKQSRSAADCAADVAPLRGIPSARKLAGRVLKTVLFMVFYCLQQCDHDL